MLEGPIGAAAFNNEFGRPNLCGYFRTFESGRERGYHKPIMLAGGVGNIAAAHAAQERRFRREAADLSWAARGLLIGMGGGAASSMGAGANVEDLDFDSVQRDNAEMQRRAQEVIDRCWQLGRGEPDPVDPRRRRRRPVERAARARARRRARRAPRAARDPVGGQRHVAARDLVQRGAGAIRARDRPRISTGSSAPSASASAARSRSLGTATADGRLVVTDSALRRIAGRRRARDDPRQAAEDAARRATRAPRAARLLADIDLAAAASRVLRHPTVADKTFLVSIGDRTVGGLCARDPLVGPWQVPVADCAVTLARLRRLRRRGVRDRRAHAARADRRPGFGPHGGRRGADQSRRARARSSAT